MKKMLSIVILFTGLIATVVQAQTLDILASDGNLNEVLAADTLAGGAQAHTVYRLVTLDETYKYTGTITITGDVTFEGVVDPVTGRPPCIQSAVLQDGSTVEDMFLLNGVGAKCEFKNIYFLGKATNDTRAGSAIQVQADSLQLTIDNCVFDAWLWYAVAYNTAWNDFLITNSNFRNMVHPNQHYMGEIIRLTWPGESYTGSMVMKGNTMLAVNGYAAAPVTKFYTKYFEFVDNKVLYTFKNPLFIFNATEAKINNNLWYGTYAGGVDIAEDPWWDNLWFPDTSYGVIALQPISDDHKMMFNPADTSLAEGLRNIEVKDNTYFWPTPLTDLWTTWNDTASNTVRTPVWMNDRTVAMFADDAKYPYLVESGNVHADPGYMANIDAELLNGTGGDDVGLLQYFQTVRSGQALTTVWGYKMTSVGAEAGWVPPWPLPENSPFPLSIEEIETPSGVPSKFNLGNVYPNPFNPSAKIQYTLEQSGITNLQVYNVLGQHLMTLIENKFQNASTYEVSFDMSEFPTGTYLVVLHQGDNHSIQKMMLLK